MDIIITGLGSLSSGCQDASSLYKASIESTVNSHLMELQTHNAIIHMPVCSVQDDLIDLNALKEFRKLDRTSQLAIHASNQAWLSSGIKEKSVASEKIGVFIGTSRGPVGKWEQTFERQISGKKQLPSFSAAGTIAAISGSVSQCLNASGPSLTISSTCSSGAAAIATGASMIHSGTCDVAVVGGVESVINESILNVMNSAGLLSNHSDHQKSCKPFDRDRNGLVVGEGAAFLILESLSHATSRGAKPLAKLSGWCNGLSQSGKVGVDLTGASIASTIKNSLKMSNLCASDIDYINAHGTSTPLGDMIELKAVKRLFESNLNSLSISSTKSMTGHLLGAAGAVEAIFSILAIQHQEVPPTINLNTPDEGTSEFDLVPNKSKKKNIKNILSNSFGFGGTNASLIFGSID